VEIEQALAVRLQHLPNEKSQQRSDADCRKPDHRRPPFRSEHVLATLAAST
jgi:hypothetical protein